MLKTSRLLLLCALLGLYAHAQSPAFESLVTGDFSPPSPAPVDALKIVSFNLHGPPTSRIEEVYQVLESDPRLQDAHIYLLQEVNRGHAGSGSRDIGLELAQRLRMHYAYAVEIAHDRGGGVRGLAILSRFPLQDTSRIQLPIEGPGGRRRIALGTTVVVGTSKVRFYNLHLETRITSQQRGEQIQGVLKDADRFAALPMAVVGDFNTITAAATKRMYEVMQGAGFSSPLPGTQVTFRRAFLVRMVLDWIWSRNLPIQEAAVVSDIHVSDHRPLWFTASLR